ncbi:MAG: zinc-binding alcohol dehydrogenase family protein [Chitinophagaceae bacterium]
MKALVCIKPGQFEYTEVKAPIIQPGHSIIRIRRIGICGTDLHAYRGTQPFFNYPRILGHELAADYVEGDINSGFVPGEALTLTPYLSCKKCIACRNGKTNCCVDIKVLGVHIDGGMVDYLSVPTDLLIKSQGLNYDELALIEPLAIGAHGIRRAGVKKDEFVLVSGAGPIGLGTMEFARIAGAKVIAVDINDARLDFCKKNLGIEYTINAAQENVVGHLKEITNGDMPTVVIDATGNQKAINNALQYLAHGGRYVLIGLQREAISFSHPEFHKRETTLMSSRNATKEDFQYVIQSVKNKLLHPLNYVTHRVQFDYVAENFESWLDPQNAVIKAMVEVG